MGYVNGGSILAVGILFPIVGVIAVSLRFYARAISLQGRGIDDWLCVPALLLDVAMGILFIYGSSKHTIGYSERHMRMGESLDPSAKDSLDRQILFQKLAFVVLLLSILGLGLIKLSVLFLYRRIFTGRSFMLANWAMITLVLLWMLAFFISTISACRTRLSAYWGVNSELLTYCVDTISQNTASAISSTLLDVAILVLPLFWIWTLQMRLKQKFVVSLIFWLGGFAIFAGWYRVAIWTIILNYDWNSGKDIFENVSGDDMMGIISIPLFWTYLEIGSALVACCLPSLKPIMDKLSVRSISSAFRTKPGSTNLASSEGSSSYAMTNVTRTPEVQMQLNLDSETAVLTRGSAKPGSVRHYRLEDVGQGDQGSQEERIGVHTDMTVYSEQVYVGNLAG